MRFEVEHHFAAPPQAVQAALADPDFHRSLRLPDVGPPEVIEHTLGDNGVAVLVVRMTFTGHIDPILRRLIGGGPPVWLQRTTIETTGGRGHLDVTADGQGDRLRATADWRCEPTDDGCVRHLAGDLSIKLPLIGATAESKVLPGLLSRLDAEAAALTARLTC